MNIRARTIGAVAAVGLALAVIAAPSTAADAFRPPGGGGADPLLLPTFGPADPPTASLVEVAPVIQNVDLKTATS